MTTIADDITLNGTLVTNSTTEINQTGLASSTIGNTNGGNVSLYTKGDNSILMANNSNINITSGRGIRINADDTNSLGLNSGSVGSSNTYLGTGGANGTLTIGNSTSTSTINSNTLQVNSTVSTNISGDVTITGDTEINTSGTSTTTIGSTSGGNVSIACSSGTIGVNTNTGSVNLGTTGNQTVNIGSSANTTNITGTTNINATGSSDTTMGNANGSVTINSAGSASGNTRNLILSTSSVSGEKKLFFAGDYNNGYGQGNNRTIFGPAATNTVHLGYDNRESNDIGVEHKWASGAFSGKVYASSYIPFTGSHITKVEGDTPIPGMCVSSTESTQATSDMYNNDITVSKSIGYKDKKVLGVFSESKGTSNFIISVGEGSMLVSSSVTGSTVDAPIENGDYITTSFLKGYGMVQDDDLMHNFTVAKALRSEPFTSDYTEVVQDSVTYRVKTIPVTFHCG